MKIKYITHDDPRLKDYDKFIAEEFTQFLTEKEPDLYLVAGGDGAMLHAIQDNLDGNASFFGKGLGTVNFLMNNFENDLEVLKKLKAEKIKPYYFVSNTIKASLDGKYLGEAVNDVIIGDKINDFITFTLTSEDGNFSAFEIKGGGICVSSAIGSTAFNYNNGGRILPLNSKLLSITGIVTNRYLNDIVPFNKLTFTANKGRILLSNVYAGEMRSGSKLDLEIGRKVSIGFINKGTFEKKRFEYTHRFRNK